MNAPKLILGYRHHQQGGECLVTINGSPLGLPVLRKDEARHSPTGFSFGYAGSGPAELARAILIALFPNDDMVRYPACYQQFKFDKIAPAKDDRLELTSTEVEEWYAAWRQSEAGQRITQEVLALRQLQEAIDQLEQAEACDTQRR